MILETITCSGIREHNDIEDILNLGKTYSMAEFAVQAHPTKFSDSMPRYVWFRTLLHACTVNNVKLAMHVNKEYCAELCRGHIPKLLKDLWDIKHRDNTPVISRIQINIGSDINIQFMPNKIADIIREYKDIEFILQYSPVQYKNIQALNDTNAPFSLLHDMSRGRGVLPSAWTGPVLSNHKMGYSGGLKPENVAENLDKISTVLAATYKTWIDAETGLASVDTGNFDAARAEMYIKNALNWQKIHATNTLTK